MAQSDNSARYRKEQDLIFQEMEEKELIAKQAAEEEERDIDHWVEWVLKFRRDMGRPAITKEDARERIVRFFSTQTSPCARTGHDVKM